MGPWPLGYKPGEDSFGWAKEQEVKVFRGSPFNLE